MENAYEGINTSI